MRAQSRVKEIPEARLHKEDWLRAVVESAFRARQFSPGETLDMGFELFESGRSLGRAAEGTQSRRGG